MNLIEEGKVVPVVGQDLLNVASPRGTKPLYAYLAEELAAYLDVSADNLTQGGELNDVACRYLAAGNQIEDIYPALKIATTKAEQLPIPDTLLKLAEIRPLKLFLSTTFDSFVCRAANQVRYGSSPRTTVLSYAPVDVQDLPCPLNEAANTVVYHLLGKVSATPAYAVTQEDVVEYFHALGSEARQPHLLFDELNRHSLLILGSRFGGWLTRFFMRLSKGQRLSAGGKNDYLADLEAASDPSLVMFLKHFSRATRIYRGGSADEFVAELHQRWTERHPKAAGEPAAESPVHDEIEPGAVFLSYASEDATAAEQIKTALEEAGVDVFFDRDQLKAGNDWELKLRRNIRDCSLFIPLISRETLTPGRRFFRVEWNLALEEAQMASFSHEEAFLLPIVIDETPIDEPAIPDRFRRVQWSSLPGGLPTADFVGRVQTLYRKHQKARVQRK